MEEPRFARDFQMGKIRISTFGRCRTIEDAARRDPGEGHRRANTRTVLDVGGGLEITFDLQADVTVPHAFVLCFTERCDTSSRDRFGQFGVEISEPGRLFADLTKAIRAKGFRVVESIASRVYYHDRTFLGSEVPPLRTELLKPPIPFAEEREVRFVWRLVEHPDADWIDVVLPVAPAGCRVLDS
jgi:hypothetical protein